MRDGLVETSLSFLFFPFLAAATGLRLRDGLTEALLFPLLAAAGLLLWGDGQSALLTVVEVAGLGLRERLDDSSLSFLLFLFLGVEVAGLGLRAVG